MPTVESMTARIWVSRLAHWPAHKLALLVEILAHIVEFLNDSFDPLSKLRACQVVIDLLHLGLLALLNEA